MTLDLLSQPVHKFILPSKPALRESSAMRTMSSKLLGYSRPRGRPVARLHPIGHSL